MINLKKPYLVHPVLMPIAYVYLIFTFDLFDNANGSIEQTKNY